MPYFWQVPQVIRVEQELFEAPGIADDVLRHVGQ